ncbi:hypothetical protein HDU86_003858 [Geranomyces michiganensis]|nr:hypothetical protein HDU86_003858 [Geranomyces michiganensis]
MQDHIASNSPNTIDFLLSIIPLKREEIMKLVSTYFAVAHPFLPIVDRANFYVMLSEGPGTFPFRCLLFAVLIVGAHLCHEPKVSTPTIEVLCDMCQAILVDYEVSHVLIVQSALVLSIMNNVKGQKFHKLIKNTWKLVGFAVRAAQELGLHRNLSSIKRPMPSNDVSAAEETRRRTWAGCYIMDRAVSMLAGRPIMVRDEDCDALPPQGYSDIAEERADIDYFEAKLSFARISGLMLQRINAAHAAWKGDDSGAAAAINDDLQIRMNKWREELPAALSWNDSSSDWTRRELLQLRFHTALLMVHRSMCGKHDSRSLKSSFAIVILLERFNNEANRLLFAGMPMSAIIAWDALLPEVSIGNTEALSYMNRLHDVMESLGHRDFTQFLVLIMLCADSLDARGIKSNLSHRKVKARIDRRNSEQQTPSEPRRGELISPEGKLADTGSDSSPAAIGSGALNEACPRSLDELLPHTQGSLFGPQVPTDADLYMPDPNEDQLSSDMVGGYCFPPNAQSPQDTERFFSTLLGDENGMPWDFMRHV